MQVAVLVAVGCNLAKPSRMIAPSPGFSSSSRFDLARRDVLREILDRVTFSLMKFLIAETGLAGGVVDSSQGLPPSGSDREISMPATTPWVMPWPESPGAT